MEPGTLELQIFVSLIVILGAAFVALICDYLKGDNQNLREHNIEMRVRKEEQDRHRPTEAVEWLQHLLGATQRNPIRFGQMRGQRGAAPAETRTPRGPAQARQAPVEATVPVEAPMPAASMPREWKPARPAMPAVAPAVPEAAPEAAPEVSVTPQEADRPRASRLAEARARRQDRPSSAPGLLQSLPVPDWLRQEQEEKAAARAHRDREIEVPPTAIVPAAGSNDIPNWTRAVQPPVVEVAGAPPKSDGFWTYHGLLDKVVAATSFKPQASEEARAQAQKKLEERFIRRAEEAAAPAVVPSVAPTVAKTVSPAVLPGAVPAITSVQQEQVVEKVQISHTTSVTQAVISTVAVDVPEHRSANPHGSSADDTPIVLNDTAEKIYETYDEWAAAHAHQTPVAPIQEQATFHRSEQDAHRLEQEPEETEEVDQAESVPAVPPVPQLQVPAGLHDKSVLSQLMQSTDVLTGVVVAIGINEYAHQMEKLGPAEMSDLMRSVEAMLSGLLRAQIDFGCRSSEDEFILIFPKETGAEAQRRLTTISERLWNFQLRSISSFSVLFSWGAVEVQSETLADAAAGASERMYQTKRSRKTVSLDSQRRKLAVNL